ncbi:MAG TPA: hypothetical protein VF463_20620 [Sphingobium sp.]
MSDDQNTYRMDVSEYYFRLTTECIRLHSNSCRKHSSFGDMINDRAELADSVTKRRAPQHIIKHLQMIPSKGEIPLEVEILESSSGKINRSTKAIEDAIGSSIEFADALSVIMFDFMVEANRTEVLLKIGLTSEEAGEYRKLLKHGAPGVKSIN